MYWVLIRNASQRCSNEYRQYVYMQKSEKYHMDTLSYVDLLFRPTGDSSSQHLMKFCAATPPAVLNMSVSSQMDLFKF